MRSTTPMLPDLARSGANNTQEPTDSIPQVPPLILPTLDLIFPAAKLTINTSINISETGIASDRRNFVTNGAFLVATLGPGRWDLELLHMLVPNGAAFNTALSTLQLQRLDAPGLITDLSVIPCSGNGGTMVKRRFPYLILNGQNLNILHTISNSNVAATHSVLVSLIAIRRF